MVGSASDLFLEDPNLPVSVVIIQQRLKMPASSSLVERQICTTCRYNFDPSSEWNFSICFNKYWYMTSIVPLCTLVQTNRGPTPRKRPATPSVL